MHRRRRSPAARASQGRRESGTGSGTGSGTTILDLDLDLDLDRSRPQERIANKTRSRGHFHRRLLRSPAGAVARRGAVALALGVGFVVAGILPAASGCGRGTLDGWTLDARGGLTSPDGETAEARCAPGDPPPIDVLFVVDESASMCEEHLALVAGFAGFAEALGSGDLRVAVTTLRDEARAGRWNTTARRTAEGCVIRRPFPASYDYHCACAACAGWDAAWYAQLRDDGQPLPPLPPLPADLSALEAGVSRYITCLAEGCPDDPQADRWVLEERIDPIYNGNGSTNRVCRFRCADEADAAGVGDARCEMVFPARSTTCLAAPADEVASGCGLRPDTEACAAEGSGVLALGGAAGPNVADADGFRCLATPPLSYGSGLEQGFRAVWEALRPDGPLAAQVCEPSEADAAPAAGTQTPAAQRVTCERAFLRPGAALVIVFVSDEDDCSLRDGVTVAPEDHGRCALLGDADNAPSVAASPRSDPRPLQSVAETAARLRAVAPDPEALFVVSVAGDVVAAVSETDRLQRRAAWSAAVAEEGPLAANAAICTSARGRASYAMRYALLADAFDERGFTVNLCAERAFEDDLAATGAAIRAALACRE